MVVKCKRLTYENPLVDYPTSTILGVIEDEDDVMVVFRTRNKRLRINKKIILCIEDTDQDFEGGFNYE